jgi:hypothetical protein
MKNKPELSLDAAKNREEDDDEAACTNEFPRCPVLGSVACPPTAAPGKSHDGPGIQVLKAGGWPPPVRGAVPPG